MIHKSKYIQLLRRNRISPNFWISDEYFHHAEFIEGMEGQWCVVVDPPNQLIVFPPIHEERGFAIEPPILMSDFWADFEEYKNPQEHKYQKKFLDYEYIYDPQQFQKMEGGKWTTFRKNCKKFPRRFGEQLNYIRVTPEYEKDIVTLLRSWSISKGFGNIQDTTAMMNFVGAGTNRKILVGNGLVLGLNIWDENYQFINYRFCITWPNIDFLQEYMRWLFYTDREIVKKEMWVNDGGILDNPKLKAFKDKLNPIKIREVHSWERIN